jgi:hypothetical protein
LFWKNLFDRLVLRIGPAEHINKFSDAGGDVGSIRPERIVHNIDSNQFASGSFAAARARQANVTTGPQQINNGAVGASHAREIENEQIQLSGGIHELLPDTRAPGKARRANTPLEALGEINRTKDPGR